MKRYIFLTADIHPVGGMQNYVAGKIKYLEKQGWDIVVFFYGKNTGMCANTVLDPFVCGGIYELSRQPFEWTSSIRKHTLKRILNIIGKCDDCSDIIVESQTDIMALWGEMIAQKIGAKHICLICNEKFRGPNKHYEENIEFFDFKLKRKEIAGIHIESLRKLFDGYKKLDDNECYVFTAANEGPVQDVLNSKIQQIEKADWNICYIGRAKKSYVPIIIKDIAIFAKEYNEKHIQFIFVGDATERKEQISEEFENIRNLDVIYLGDLVPIPRELFNKVDVVIAGSGCADCSARELVPTIVADADCYLANGVLGYTTFEIIFGENKIEPMHYDQLLREVLVENICKNIPFHLEKRLDAEFYYDEHMQFIKSSDKKKEYYIFDKKGKMCKKDIIKYYIKTLLPSVYKKYKDMRNG